MSRWIATRACAATATTFAATDSPSRSATLARVITSAAAPAEMEEALAAVIVPSLAKAGFSVGILSGRAFPGCSSSVTCVSPARLFTVTGTTSSAKRPSPIAALARDRLSIA